MPAKRNAFNVSLAFATQVKISREHNPIEKMPEFLAKDVDSVKRNVSASAPFESEFNPSEMCQHDSNAFELIHRRSTHRKAKDFSR